jgi:hypothetical protein
MDAAIAIIVPSEPTLAPHARRRPLLCGAAAPVGGLFHSLNVSIWPILLKRPLSRACPFSEDF